jgi:putative hydrolase of the HAD superfamily
VSADRLRAVTFDCWSTLLYERDPGATYARRVEAVARVAEGFGAALAGGAARAALDAAWTRHLELWREGAPSGAPQIAGWALEGLVAAEALEEAAGALAPALAEAVLDSEVCVLEGAGRSLARLAERGLRRALICDTGMAPGRVVRQLLDRAGLLEHLEVVVFSDEAGVPKPHPAVFEQALRGLGLASDPACAVHVGDLRRTDVAGGRGFGMGTVRIRGHYDDPSDLPDADAVADSHAHLLDLLAL